MRRATSRAALFQTADLRRSPDLAQSLQSILCLSDTPFDTKPALSRHGGARLRADRTSDYIAADKARDIMLAALAAHEVCEPFTRMVTVHWQMAGIPDDRAAEATGRLTKLAGDWARQRGARILWAWTRELDRGKGSHLHLLIACPAHLHIGRMWRRWLKVISGRTYVTGAVLTKRIGGTLTKHVTDPAGYRQHLFGTVAYLCKGIRPEDAAGMGIKDASDQGRVIGKRSAVCQALLSGKSHV